jgi:hypothetical protein
MIAFAGKASGSLDIYTMRADGSAVTNLTTDAATDFEPSWQPLFGSPSSVGPTPSHITIGLSPNATPQVRGCDASSASDDFDGDGEPDKATVARTDCPAGSPGPEQPPYSLTVEWGNGASGVVGLPDCGTTNGCEALGTADLDGNGTRELAIVVDRNAYTVFLEFFELSATEVFGSPVIIAPPGTEDYPGGKTAVLPLVGSGSTLHFLSCTIGNDGHHAVVATAAVLSEDQSTWSLSETVFAFEPVKDIPFGQFNVVSSRDYSEPAREGMDPVQDPCFPFEFPGP